MQRALSVIVRFRFPNYAKRILRLNSSGQKKMPPPPKKRIAVNTKKPAKLIQSVPAPTAKIFTDKDIAKGFETKNEKEQEKKELSKIPYIHQLPVDIQKVLPEFHISFHSYSTRSSSRLVSINGKVMREGQTMDPGIELEKITNDGVVLLYKSRRFRVDV